jgi:SH3-like domain-containing protein
VNKDARPFLLLALISLACSLTTPPEIHNAELIPVHTPRVTSVVEPMATQTPPPALCVVSAHTLQLRECGGTNCTVRDWLNFGVRLSVLQKSNGWFQVTTPNGTTGWVNAKFCGGIP